MNSWNVCLEKTYFLPLVGKHNYNYKCIVIRARRLIFSLFKEHLHLLKTINQCFRTLRPWKCDAFCGFYFDSIHCTPVHFIHSTRARTHIFFLSSQDHLHLNIIVKQCFRTFRSWKCDVCLHFVFLVFFCNLIHCIRAQFTKLGNNFKILIFSVHKIKKICIKSNQRC